MDFFKHDIQEEEALAVAQAIRDGHISTGVKLKEFAKALEDRFRFPKVELCSSGTSALHLTLHALGVGPGDHVITTPYVGVWTSNPILMVGATPVYADIDRRTYNLDPLAVLRKVTEQTKVIMPVSVNGNPVNLKGLRSVLDTAGRQDIRIVCDDIEALGSTRNGKYVGEDIGNDISVNAFWVSKQVTCGGGGMVTSEDRDFLKKFEGLTRHGHGLVGNMWDQHFGFNAWLSDPMAAMGVVQVKRYDDKQESLLKVKAMLDVYFRDYRKQELVEDHTASEFIYLIELPEGIDKRTFAERMEREHCIPTRPYFNSLLEVPHLKRYASPCPIATEVSKRTMALPYHWKMTEQDVLDVYAAFENVILDMGGHL